MSASYIVTHAPNCDPRFTPEGTEVFRSDGDSGQDFFVAKREAIERSLTFVNKRQIVYLVEATIPKWTYTFIGYAHRGDWHWRSK